jgi:hypothetical protein
MTTPPILLRVEKGRQKNDHLDQSSKSMVVVLPWVNEYNEDTPKSVVISF